MPRTKLRALDAQSFAGGFALGVVQAGFQLVGKREMPGGFGVMAMDGNRHLLGDWWDVQSAESHEWEVVDADLLFGNPPCSGFSLLSSKHFRGMDSPINACMWAMADFAGRVMPQILIFESVQQAYNQGGDLMRRLREKLEEDTGERWHLTHVLHNALSVGGAAMRKRYFFVASRVPFGIELPAPRRLPDVFDVIGDLENLAETNLPQPYRAPASWWAKNRRSPDNTVAGMVTVGSPAVRRMRELLEAGDYWKPWTAYGEGLRAHYAQHGRLTPMLEAQTEKIVAKDFQLGYSQPGRWGYDGHCRVVTGAGLGGIMHPRAPRPLTHREIARIMGFPDDWSCQPYIENSGGTSWYGKGIPVDCGRWIAGWAKTAIEGNPGGYRGDLIGERESLINCTTAYKAAIAA